MESNSEGKSKSLQKALTVLNCFAEKPSWGVTELSEHLGLYKSNVYTILNTFKAADYLEQDEQSGKYQLGVGLFALSRALNDSFSITRIALPYMQEISDITGERVYIAIPSQDEVVYLNSAYPASALDPMRNIIGKHAPMYCTGIGKALMAHISESKLEEYIHKDLHAYTETTITTAEGMREELRNVRQNGYAVDNMEHEYGVKCVAVPIFNHYGVPEAAISITGPSLRFTEDRITEMAQLLKLKIHEIEEHL